MAHTEPSNGLTCLASKVWQNAVTRLNICRFAPNETLSRIVHLDKASCNTAIEVLYHQIAEVKVNKTLGLCDKNRYVHYAAAVRCLELDDASHCHRLLGQYPRLSKLIVHDNENCFDGHIDLKRDGHTRAIATIIRTYHQWWPAGHTFRVHDHRKYGEMLPGDWTVDVLSSLALDKNERDGGNEDNFRAAVGLYRNAAFELVLAGYKLGEVASLVEALGTRNRLKRLDIDINDMLAPDVPDGGPQLPSTHFADATNGIEEIGLFLDPALALLSRQQLHKVRATLDVVKRFKKMTFHVWTRRWTVDDAWRIARMLDCVTPWSDTINERDAPRPQQVLIEIELYDANDIKRIEDPDTFALFTRLIRFAASVMLIVGGSAAEYKVTLSGERLNDQRYTDLTREIIGNTLNRILLDEISRLIAEGKKGNSVGWRRLEVAERRRI